MTKSAPKGGRTAKAYRRGNPGLAASKKRGLLKARIRSIEVRIALLEEILEVTPLSDVASDEDSGKVK